MVGVRDRPRSAPGSFAHLWRSSSTSCGNGRRSTRPRCAPGSSTTSRPACSRSEPHALQIDLDDEHAQMQSMVPVPGDELPVRACVSIWLDAHDDRAPYEAHPARGRACGARATSSPSRCTATTATTRTRPSATGPTAPAHPGIITLTIFDKPAGVDDETFYGHWYGHQSPMSEDMQPRAALRAQRGRARASRRARRATARSSRSRGRASSTSRTCTRSSAPSSNEELGENIRVMLDSTKLLYDPATMRNYPLSEYILKS